METVTAWLKAPSVIAGLDHLAVQAPCINIYSRLLPGITNVTERARYYTFYPWFIWSFAQRAPSPSAIDFVQSLRRADCLFTLIAERHAYLDRNENGGANDERHGIGLVGRNTLTKALKTLCEDDAPLWLSAYATQENVPTRYFQNKFGGLGQYYRGTLQELEILNASGRDIIQYTIGRGDILAEAMDASVDGDFFFRVLAEDQITAETLDALAPFCPCYLPVSGSEHQALVDLFFDRQNLYREEGRQRRSTLALLLHLIKTLSAHGENVDDQVFRGCVYTNCLPNHQPWHVPPMLHSTREAWAIYVRNDILSLAIQAIFYVTLAQLDHHAGCHATSQAFAQWFLSTTQAQTALDHWANIQFATLIETARSTLPALTAWEDPRHEHRLACDIRSSKEPSAAMLHMALEILVALVARDSADRSYGPFDFSSDYFGLYPINLQTLRDHAQGAWSQLTMSELVAWLVTHWGIDTHLRVALRKLRHEMKDTFRVKPTDRGLEYIENTGPPVFTNPRFRQAVQILLDIAAIDRNEAGHYVLTPLGHNLLEDTCGR
jgi:hypothetical protein